MKKKTNKNSKEKLIKFVKNNFKMFLIIGIVIIAIIIAIITTSNKKELPNPQLDPNYNGLYDESSGKLKVKRFFNGKDYVIDNCRFFELKFVSSPTSSMFSGRFISNNDKITGIVLIDFILYDKDKKVVERFSNKLRNVKKGDEYKVWSIYPERDINNVDSIKISIK